jgi:radical SAM protein with 4Fe4S-binding SPASM domain
VSAQLVPSFFDLTRRLMAEHVPLHALFEITERCNYACPHCYLPHDGHDELSTEEAFGVLDALADAGTLFLTITGGEIFLRRDFWEIAGHAKHREFVTRYFTNGFLVDEAKADRLAGLEPMAVEISLYGPDAATFETVTRVPGSFEKTTRAIRLLTERGVRVVAKSPVMSVNARRIEETHDLALSLGAKFTFDALISPMDGGEITPLSLRASAADLAVVFEFEKRLREQSEPGPVAMPEGKALDEAPCNAGRGSVAISPRGDVYACVAIKQSAGNVRERPFAEIWNATGGVLGALRGITVATLRACSTCEDRPWCPRCAGVARHEDGALDAPSLEACRIAATKRAVFEGRPIPADPVLPAARHHRALPVLA